MKGQISIIEAVMASIILFVSFNLLINTGTYQNKWNDATAFLAGRDSIITVDRLGNLYQYSFSQSSFNNFLSNLTSTKDFITQVNVQGTSPAVIEISCNCTQTQIDYVRTALQDVKLNSRKLSADICFTNLDTINSCSSTQKYPDILIIWGYNNLTSNLVSLTNLINNGGSIIEIADLTSNQVDLSQQRLFGIQWLDQGNFPGNIDQLLVPSVTSADYQSFKWFYHLPYVLKAAATNRIPTENGIQSCASTASIGTFEFDTVNRTFWICDTSSVYFDTDGNNIADMVVNNQQTFSINSSNFKINYIDDNFTIRLSFKQNYGFKDFISPDNSHNKLFPINNDISKVLLYAGFYNSNTSLPAPVMILNGTDNAKAVWLADFSRNGFGATGDDNKQLLTSLIFSLPNHAVRSPTTSGQVVSYINSIDNDMFEVYKVDLKIVRPF